MEWFNVIGLVFLVAIMIPNIVYAIKCKDGFENTWKNKPVEIIEQIGRFGCFGFMIINIPDLVRLVVWRSVCNLCFDRSLLIILYCILWVVLWKKTSVF